MKKAQDLLIELHQNLKILRAREVRYAGNAPLDLLNQIRDHEQAVTLTEQVLAGDLGKKEWRAALQPLALSIRPDQAQSRVDIGDIAGNIQGSNIAGRDIIDIQFVTHIVQQAGGQPLPTRNLPAQQAALEAMLPHLTNPAERAGIEAAMAALTQAIDALPAHEAAFRQRIRTKYGEDASYYIPLQAETTEAEAPSLEPEAARSERRRRARAMAEYCEWLPMGQEIRRVKLNSLREGVAKYDCIILLGDPGSGKTISLENLAYQLAGEADRLPLPLRLSGFSPGLSLEEFILEGWGGMLAADRWGAPDLAANLDGYLDQGRLFFLFDALNEMPHDGYPARALELRRFIEQWSPQGNRFLVTCRALDYGEELAGLQRVEIQPLNDDQIQAFIRVELPDTWSSLWAELAANEEAARRLLDMARNPYILTMMIDVYVEDGRLGRNRAELMTRFTQILLTKEKVKVAAEDWLDPAVQREALSVMAFEMQKRAGSGAAVATDLVKTVMPPQVQTDPQWPPRPAPPDRVLTLAAGANIVEMPVDRSSVRFYHQLLQEYFAARRMLKEDPDSLVDLWRWPWLETEMPLWKRPEDNDDPLPAPPSTGWEETTILAAGLAPENDDQLLRAMIRVNPVLAGRCLHEGRAQVEPATRQSVIDALLTTISRAEVALRVRIAAGDVLGYLGDPRLGQMVTIPAGNFIMGEGREQHHPYLSEYRLGKYPLTNAEIRPFIEAGSYNQKRWWTKAGWQWKRSRTELYYWDDVRFNKPNQPVAGISWYEAVAFCRWLSAETEQLYRLPTEAEWEKGARGDDGWAYPWGRDFEASRLNANEGEQIVRATTPIGIYPTGVSPYGAFDCTGNVLEWCATQRRKSYPYNTREDEWLPGYLEGTGDRALRGGSTSRYRVGARWAARVAFAPLSGFFYDFIGCRLVSPSR